MPRDHHLMTAQADAGSRGADAGPAAPACEIRLPYAAPFDWPSMLRFYRLRAIDGVEQVEDAVYRRSVRIEGGYGLLEVRDAAPAGELRARINPSSPGQADSIAARLRRSFDLDADLVSIGQHLGRDPVLAAMVAQRPAVRIPGHWEPFETAIRAVLGQQVTLAATRILIARLVERAGPAIGDPAPARPHRLFPTPEQVLAADLSAMGMPGARVRTLWAVAEAVLADPNLFRRGGSVEETVERLCAIKGVGPWTAQYIALRACREPDAFPASDVGLLRGMAVAGRRPTPAELLRRAEAWRPFRAYAAHHIWAGDDGVGPGPPVRGY